VAGAIILTIFLVSAIWLSAFGIVKKKSKKTAWSAREVFAAHYSLVLKGDLDAPPKSHVVINCMHCGTSIVCPIQTIIGFVGKQQTVKVNVDTTNLEAHELGHSFKDRKVD